MSTAIDLELRRCAICGKKLRQKDYGTRRESTNDFRGRKTCGLECGRKMSGVEKSRQFRRTLESKECVICGRQIKILPSDQVCNFKVRKTCSGACARESQRRAVSGEHWEPPEDVSLAIQDERELQEARLAAPAPKKGQRIWIDTPYGPSSPPHVLEAVKEYRRCGLWRLYKRSK